MAIVTLGIDLAKNVFALHGVDAMGKAVLAWLGLVPGQYSSGGKQRLGRITKAGDPYLLSLLTAFEPIRFRNIQASRGRKRAPRAGVKHGRFSRRWQPAGEA